MASLTSIRCLGVSRGVTLKLDRHPIKTVLNCAQTRSFILEFFAKRRKPPSALATIDYEEEEGVDAPPVKYVAPPPAYSPSLVYVGSMDNGVYSLRQFSLFICNVLAVAAPIMMYRQTLDLTVCALLDS